MDAVTRSRPAIGLVEGDRATPILARPEESRSLMCPLKCRRGAASMRSASKEPASRPFCFRLGYASSGSIRPATAQVRPRRRNPC